MRTINLTCVRTLLAVAVVQSCTALFAVPLTGGTGPGGFIQTGLTSDLTMWLRGDQGITKDGLNRVSQWDDQSGRSNHVKQATTNNQPLQNTTLNNVPVVVFDGGGQGVNADFLITDGALTGQTIFIVNRADGTPAQPNPILGNSTNYVSIRRDSGSWQHPGNSDDFTNPVGGSFHVNGAAGTTSTVGVAQQFAAGRSNAFAFTRVQLTRHGPAGAELPERSFQGVIGEVVIVNRALNPVERIIVENSLSAKFNLPLNTGSGAIDRYAGDAAPDHFDFGVFGIGDNGTNEVDNAGFQGFGVEVAAGSLSGSDQWVFAGHANGPNGTTTNDMLGGQRWERSWYVDTTNVTTASLSFDWDDAANTATFNPRFNGLYYRASNSGPFTLLMDGGVDIADQRVDFLNVNLEDGFYTLGIAPVPEPTSFVLLGLGSIGILVRTRRRGRSAT